MRLSPKSSPSSSITETVPEYSDTTRRISGFQGMAGKPALSAGGPGKALNGVRPGSSDGVGKSTVFPWYYTPKGPVVHPPARAEICIKPHSVHFPPFHFWGLMPKFSKTPQTPMPIPFFIAFSKNLGHLFVPEVVAGPHPQNTWRRTFLPGGWGTPPLPFPTPQYKTQRWCHSGRSRKGFGEYNIFLPKSPVFAEKKYILEGNGKRTTKIW